MFDECGTGGGAVAVGGPTRVPMTEFDLRALGWVVTRDAFWEVARSLAGRTPRLPLTAMQGLAERWQTLQAVAAKSSGPLWTRIVSSPLLRAMSVETRAAATDYLTLLSASCPELYSPPVLRERCRRACAQTFAGLGGSMVLGSLAGPAYPLTADVALALFAIGGWHLITFLQLRCVRKLISQLAPQPNFRAPGILR
jgi:hypothetical protein